MLFCVFFYCSPTEYLQLLGLKYLEKQEFIHMKKILAFFLTFILVLSVSACTSKNDAADSGSENNENTASALDVLSLTDIAAQTADGSGLEFYSFMTEPVDSSTAAYLIGTESIDTPFSEAVAHVPMMNTNPFTMIVFRVSETPDAQALASELEEKADLRKLICVEAEAADTVVNGGTVLFIMGSQSEIDAIINAFNNL